VIGRADENALLVGFQDRSGKRLLFRSGHLPFGGVVSEILHLNPLTGRIERLINGSDDINPATGKRLRDFKVNGTNLLANLRAKKDKQPGHLDAGRRVAGFLDTESGVALLAAIPAIYAALEDDEVSEKEAALKKPFGLWAMMLQMNGEKYRGLQDVGHFSSHDKKRRMEEACASEDCQFRGKNFLISRSGFFDVISKPRSRTASKSESMFGIAIAQPAGNLAGIVSANGKLPPIQSVNSASAETCRDQRANDANFGKCGSGAGLFDSKLPECIAHDFCVCLSESHLSCMITLPSVCDTTPGECGTLVDAVTAVSEYVFAPLFNLIENTLDAIAEFVFGVVEFSVEVISEIVSGIIDLVGAFLDWLFGDSCEEESAEAC
jgi:hypothetical protein